MAHPYNVKIYAFSHTAAPVSANARLLIDKCGRLCLNTICRFKYLGARRRIRVMLIDVRDILKASGLSKSVELEFAADGCGISGADTECAFDELFTVKAELSNVKGMIRVKGRVRTGYGAYCARCLKPVRVNLDVALDDEFVQFGSLGPVLAEDAEVYEYSDKEIDIGLAVRNAVLLEIPIRHLCREGCRSLCQVCGKDLNEGECDCGEPPGDIRLAALNAFFQDRSDAK